MTEQQQESRILGVRICTRFETMWGVLNRLPYITRLGRLYNGTSTHECLRIADRWVVTRIKTLTETDSIFVTLVLIKFQKVCWCKFTCGSCYRFDPILNEYLFDRRPRFFPDILGLYQVESIIGVDKQSSQDQYRCGYRWR